MTQISMSLPELLRKTIQKLAEKISALATEDYLAERAARGSREKFVAASKVADVEPEECDQL